MAQTVGAAIDTSDFKAVVKALKKAQPLTRLELLRNLKMAGTLVADDARAIASEYSESIPPTIKTRVRGAGVAVEAGGVGGKGVARSIFSAGYGTGESSRALQKAESAAEEGLAIAGLFELGNKGKSSGGTFRHPVYGNDAWVQQPMHPYLLPAGKKNEAKVEALVLEALDRVTEVIVLDD